MNLNLLHFAHPAWLWIGCAIPIVWLLHLLANRTTHHFHQLNQFIDSHLLPYLLLNSPNKKSSRLQNLLLWSLVWGCLTLALAGPRWSFREMETFSPDQSLVVLLDLSESMNATDIKPSRLVRAKQKIEDLLTRAKGVKIGLIAFAADPHMITPLTDDKETIRHILPSLDTSLVYVQGSRLASALDMAATLLNSEPGNNKAVLVISDGGFEDSTAIFTAKKLAEKGIVIHTMGVGTTEGTRLYAKKGPSVLSKLEKERLSEISSAGHGQYLEADYSDHGETIVLNELAKRAEAQMNIGKKDKIWDEHFYWMILPALPIMLWWFRRGYLFSVVLFLFVSPFNLEAQDYFKNREECGKEFFDAGDFETATNTFQDPYRKGVAYYKANQFAEAEKMFRQSNRPEVACSAAYNLGNSLVQQQKLKEAIIAYENVLEGWPDHTRAKENLELVKKMLEEQQQQESSDSKNSEQNQEENSEDSKENQSEEDQQPNEENQESQPQEQQETENEKKEQPAKMDKSQEDIDADQWLNQITQDQTSFLKNKFYIESKRNETKEGIDPW